MSMRTRVAALTVVLVAVAAAISGVLSYRATRDETLSTIDRFLDDRAARFIPAGPPSGSVPPPDGEVIVDGFPSRPPSPPPTGDRSVAGDDRLPPPPFDEDGRPLPPPVVLDDLIANDAMFGLIDPNGEVIVASDDMIARFVPDELEPGVVQHRSMSSGGTEYRVRSEKLADGAVTVSARSLDETNATLDGVRLRLLLVASAVTLIAGLLGFFAAGYIVTPLRRLSTIAENVAETGELTDELDATTGDEVGQLSVSIQRMLAALRTSRDQQRRLIADASHELRTPLTTVRANVDMLEAGKLTEADREVALSLIRAEVDELTNLSAELSELASAESFDIDKVSVDVVEIVRAAVSRGRRRHGRAIELEVPRRQTVMIDGNAAALDRAVSNLLANAAKFTPANSPITVRVDSDCVSVVDHGPGIPEGDIDRVFERFYRAADARRLPGSGLGLSIVRETARAHNGRAFARNHPTGATVGFTFR